MLRKEKPKQRELDQKQDHQKRSEMAEEEETKQRELDKKTPTTEKE